MVMSFCMQIRSRGTGTVVLGRKRTAENEGHETEAFLSPFFET